MYSAYQVGEDLEDDLYQDDEGDSEASEANSELEFHLYSQLHYSSNAGEMGELVDAVQETAGQVTQRLEVTAETADGEKENEPTEARQIRPLDTSNIALNKKEKKKCLKKKKKKSCPEKQNLPISFEEVIVIDSGPEVISVSDDSASSDNTGVCALKGRGSHRMQTSTPASQTRFRAPGTPLNVDSSSPESDSDEPEPNLGSCDSPDSSDSDHLENWMILGQGNQDGDQSISLNLEGKLDSNADFQDPEDWLVSDKDKEAQIYNKPKDARAIAPPPSHRYYTSKNVQCRNCNKYGHLSKNCPEPKKSQPCFLCGTHGHLSGQCPTRHCNNCGLPGHVHDSCTERAYWHKQCHRCSMTGHFFDVCPEIWRQYHYTIKAGIPVKKQEKEKVQTSAYCYNCAKRGHHGYMCTKQRMYNGTFPNTPFINHYDTAEDVKRREHRIKLKVRDLQMNGQFPTGPQTASTQEPSKKKPKITHPKTSSRPGNAPHNHNKHIFFKDYCQQKGPALKSKKHKPQESTGSVKPWKPKRPVPASKETAGKIVFDEADDFPRGGGTEQNRKRFKRFKQGPQDQSQSNRPAWLGGTAAAAVATARPDKKKTKRGRGSKLGAKKREEQTYPADENLFIIKQRRRAR